MRNLSLFAQITLTFILAFVLTSLILGIFTTRSVDAMYENAVFERLEAEGKAFRLAKNKNEFELSEDLSYIRYLKTDNTYFKSDNLMDYIDEDAIELLIGKAMAQTTYQGRYSNKIGDNLIYYVILNYQSVIGFNEDVFIMIADSSLKDDMVKVIRRRIYYICLVSFSFGYIIILIWTMKFIDDTRKISYSLKKLGDSNYQNMITTRRKDEMGELVKDIETMRIRMIENELLRQEVVQGISHDLKTPITLISSYAEAYEDGMCKAEELSDIAKRETKRLHSKVTKLLNLTRLGYIDKDMSTMRSSSMKELIQKTVKLYDYQVKIKFELDLADAEFLGDKESWQIVLQNILDNAMRYAKSYISIKLTKSNISICNDGKNIKEEDISNIFNAYIKGKDGDSGLGLYIVKRTVEIFGYKAEAINLKDGVCFYISKM